jgi:argininosuccinate lyase
LAHLLCAHAEALLRDAGQMRATYGAINVCPLGAAAGYGTSWPIDRRAVARHLGFAGVQENSVDCVSSRWEMEARLVADLAFAGNHLAVLAQDLVVWSHPFAGFLTFDERHVTGSSIMPQKRNPDFAEVTRAKAAVVHGVLQSLLALNKGMVSGYNRDSQWSKYLVMSAVEELRESPGILGEVLAGIEVDTERMAEAAQGDFLVAVDLADLIARHAGLPFRRSYDIVARLVRECESVGRFTIERIERALAAEGLEGAISRRQLKTAIEPARAVRAKNSLGGPAPIAARGNLNRVRKAARALDRWNRQQRAALERAHHRLAGEIREAD